MEVSSPHPVSQIRLVRFTNVPADETTTDRVFRTRRENTQLMHHEFWSKNNRDFQQAKTEFEENVLKTTGKAATSADLSVFYREYLESSRASHMAYNRKWWKENFSMLVPAYKADVEFLYRAVGKKIFGVEVDAALLEKTMTTLAGKSNHKGYGSLLGGSLYRAHGVSVR
ncbi:hypothetical protein HDU76_013003 [Blyttiomyces sp. JEL0837]|nr:hypothetical protein HDU76_013003 [Blyttiomyces sp. JEL0837]